MRDDIIRMAREAGLGDTGVQCGFVFFQPGVEGLKRFAELVRADEREACAKVCEKLYLEDQSHYRDFSSGRECADAIRARGNT